ncbi:MAG: GIY-YIG nuclease family protein [Vicinamibacterales bacterium]
MDASLDGFSSPMGVHGRATVADLFPPSRRCGLYVLHFANGEIYVGQAVDVTRRFVQHRIVHNDIARISFRRCGRRRLDEEERALIWQLEAAGQRLRNVTFTSLPKGESDIDLVVTLEEQERWLADPRWCDMSGTRIQNDDLRRKYARHCRRLMDMPRSDAVVRLLQEYVSVAIPAPVRTEVSFWSLSCLPSGPTQMPGERVLARLNLPWQVVLTLSELHGEIDASFFLAQSPLERAFGPLMTWLRDNFPTLFERDELLEPGGHDQMNLIVTGADEIRRFLQQPDVVTAIRTFNFRLMKKGACSMYSRYHCLDLADRTMPRS